jgi:replication factor C subunit 3/5
MSEKKNIIPWIEKYRPTHFNDIVLDPNNRIIFENIIHQNTFPNLLFYGPPGSGKCFKENTPILMFNGEIKMVQDIAVDDVIMGDDSTPRNVLSLGRGQDQLYDVVSERGDEYCVNSEHILCLKLYDHLVELSIKEYLTLPENVQSYLKVYKTGVEFRRKPTALDPYHLGILIGSPLSFIPENYKINDRDVRLNVLAGILDNQSHYNEIDEVFFIQQSKTPLDDDILFLVRSLGFVANTFNNEIVIFGNDLHQIPTKYPRLFRIKDPAPLSSSFTVVPQGRGTYYGFTLDGNNRFVLGDFSVTHNTSTIINLINEYQHKNNIKNHVINKGNIIHLNASDERGIDIIRNQIYQFVSSKNLFDNGVKFVVLDEVDYMTKNAQQALKYLLQTSTLNVRFCLICNYVSKIDESLQNEFICIRFNQLPKTEIFKFIKNISDKENIHLSDSMIEKIQSIYQSDIRSMINFIQSNHNTLLNKSVLECIIHSELWDKIHCCFVNKEPTESIKECIQSISVQYNIDKKQIIQNYFNYIIRGQHVTVSRELLNIVEMVIHNNENIPTNIVVDYFILSLSEYWTASAS